MARSPLRPAEESTYLSHGMPTASFAVEDVHREWDRPKQRGVRFAAETTKAGAVVVGLVGSAKLLEFTVMGDAVRRGAA